MNLAKGEEKMSKEFDFTSYIQMVDFLGACLGEDTEVVLHDFKDVDHSIIAIHNGHISGRAIGGPITDFILSKLKDKGKEGPPYYLNYLGMSKDNTPLRCSSFFILDKQGNPKGMLCINTDVTRYQQVVDIMQKLAFIPEVDDQVKVENVESFRASPKDVISDIISDVTNSSGVPVGRLTVDEKMEIVRRLNNEKLFLIKRICQSGGNCADDLRSNGLQVLE